jgi:hypothetical protein
MSIDRTIVLTGKPQADAAISCILNNYKAMADSGHPMAARMYEHKDTRTLEQQSLMWIRLSEISAQAWVGGRQFDADTWHCYAKKQFLPEEDGPTKFARKGYRKWTILPSGERELYGSTTQLTTAGMAEYMTALMAYGSTELGVMFSATPREIAEFGR